MKALFAGSFDPITLGHLDIMERASRIFDCLVIGVGVNPEKDAWLSPTERIDLIKPHLKDGNLSKACDVQISSYSGLTVHFAKGEGAHVLIRGVRDATDLRKEMEMARINRRLSSLETLFLQPSDDKLVLSSSLVRQVFFFGSKDATTLEGMVPYNVIRFLAARCG